MAKVAKVNISFLLPDRPFDVMSSHLSLDRQEGWMDVQTHWTVKLQERVEFAEMPVSLTKKTGTKP